MTVRCDHCRRPLGVLVRRYWHMRFCSAACVQAYQRRLQDGTKQKIAKIRHTDSGGGEQPRLAARLFGRRAQPDPARRLAG
jgi:hypothetical protein